MKGIWPLLTLKIQNEITVQHKFSGLIIFLVHFVELASLSSLSPQHCDLEETI